MANWRDTYKQKQGFEFGKAFDAIPMKSDKQECVKSGAEPFHAYREDTGYSTVDYGEGWEELVAEWVKTAPQPEVVRILRVLNDGKGQGFVNDLRKRKVKSARDYSHTTLGAGWAIR